MEQAVAAWVAASGLRVCAPRVKLKWLTSSALTSCASASGHVLCNLARSMNRVIAALLAASRAHAAQALSGGLRVAHSFLCEVPAEELLPFHPAAMPNEDRIPHVTPERVAELKQQALQGVTSTHANAAALGVARRLSISNTLPTNAGGDGAQGQVSPANDDLTRGKNLAALPPDQTRLSIPRPHERLINPLPHLAESLGLLESPSYTSYATRQLALL